MTQEQVEKAKELIFELKRSNASIDCITSAQHAVYLLQNNYNGFEIGIAVGKMMAKAIAGKQFTAAYNLKDFIAELLP